MKNTQARNNGFFSKMAFLENNHENLGDLLVDSTGGMKEAGSRFTAFSRNAGSSG